MDQTRKLLLVLESDPKAATLPLLGMYVVISHPFPRPCFHKAHLIISDLKL